MSLVNFTVAAGQSVSSAFTIDRADRSAWVYCSSHTGIGAQLQFAPSSASAIFGPITNFDGTSAVWSFSSDAWAIVPSLPSPWARLKLLGANATSTTSFMLVSGRGNS